MLNTCPVKIYTIYSCFILIISFQQCRLPPCELNTLWDSRLYCNLTRMKVKGTESNGSDYTANVAEEGDDMEIVQSIVMQLCSL